jgi:hypothetical protein
MSKKRTRQIIVGNTPLNVDFGELQKQRHKLARLTGDMFDSEEMDGLQYFLDAFVDAAAEVLGEKVVFGKETK